MVKQSELELFVFIIVVANFIGFVCAIMSLNQSKHLIGINAIQTGIASVAMHAIGCSTSLVVLIWVSCCGVRVY